MNNINIHTATPQQLTEHLVERRKQLGLTQAQLALRLGVSPQQVSKLESGSQDVMLHTLTNWALALGSLPTLTDWDGNRAVTIGRDHARNTVGIDLADMVGGVAVSGAIGSGSSEIARLILERLSHSGVAAVVADPGATPGSRDLIAPQRYELSDATTWPQPGSVVQWRSCNDAAAAVGVVESLVEEAAAERDFHGRDWPLPVRAVLIDATRTLIGQRLPVARLTEAMKKAASAGVIVIVSYRGIETLDGDADELIHATSIQIAMSRSLHDPLTERLAEIFSTPDKALTALDLHHLDFSAYLRRIQPNGSAVVQLIKPDVQR